MESMKVAGHAYNYLKNASGRQETELYVPPLPSQHISCSLYFIQAPQAIK